MRYYNSRDATLTVLKLTRHSTGVLDANSLIVSLNTHGATETNSVNVFMCNGHVCKLCQHFYNSLMDQPPDSTQVIGMHLTQRRRSWQEKQSGWHFDEVTGSECVNDLPNDWQTFNTMQLSMLLSYIHYAT